MRLQRYGVIVVGGGPAGVAAAIAAARNGAKVLLLESGGCLGGMMTSGLLSMMGSFDDMDRHLDRELDARLARKDEETCRTMKNLPMANRIIRGIPEEIIKSLVQLGGALDFGTGCLMTNPETAKFLLDKMVAESGAAVLFNTQVVDVVRRGNRIQSVVTANKDGIREVAGDIFVDASGDGDVAAFAGAPFQKGNPKNGEMQGVTLIFRMGGVKFFGRSYIDGREMVRCNRIFRRLWEEGKISGQYIVAGCITSVPGMKGVVSINTQHTFRIDATKPEDVTKAIINGRMQVREIAGLYKKYVKGFENSYLIDTAPMLGVRETRRIMGEYVLTKEDVLEGRKFKDSVCNGGWGLDIHIPDKKIAHSIHGMTKAWGMDYRAYPAVYGEPGEKRGKTVPQRRPGTWYNIPYRCIVPKKVTNLLVAGRCISVTHEALGATRIMPHCMATGQAAGTAAAICARRDILPKNLNAVLLQKALSADGAIF